MKEAHPEKWKGKVTRFGGKEFPLDQQPKTMEHRIALANHLFKGKNLTVPIYLDDMKGSARKAFGSFHMAQYVIKPDGRLGHVRAYGRIGSSLRSYLAKETNHQTEKDKTSSGKKSTRKK